MANGNLFLLPTCLNTENSLFFSFSLFRKTQTTIFLESAFAISTCLTTAMEMNSKKYSMNSKQHPISLLYGFPHHYSSFIFRITEVHTYHSQQGIHLYAIHMTLTPRPAITNHWKAHDFQWQEFPQKLLIVPTYIPIESSPTGFISSETKVKYLLSLS